MTLTTESDRLHTALAAAGLHALSVSSATPAVASPLRLACEWAGFHVESADGHFYAKVLHDDMRPLIDFAHSVEATRCAAEAGVTPAVALADATHGVLLLEALPATQWHWARLDTLQADARLAGLWQLKRAVHAGPAPAFARSPMADLDTLRALCRGAAVALPGDHEWLDECADLAWAALQCTPAEPRPLHGDGLASNVMVNADGELRLLDFDRGGCFDPWYDVATVLNELYPFEPQWRAGIARWNASAGDAEYARCRLYALLDDWYWTLWGLWAGETSTRPLEFSKVGQWTLLRCRMTVQEPRFESWLRQVRG
ncbi:aminoglycoside phosphotransferase family protein [Pseudomonas typographi]|uniref:aminoglycoside phosphotransferase family protein n=1 Tax=Pseudomonas typographi TaxID=2715964 RepID=UPI0016877947|nr:aminoglycoside phosphotransferase family protein [Pseudomonas typographi]MBD1551497.1 aminoglycoside phosphotransferase family protein [Pseudomonas typographi]